MNNMVKLKFIIKDGVLVLRISEKKERYYKSVRHLLIGQPNLKYWMKEHERFSSHAPSCAKNNYYCPLNIDIPIPTLCNTGVGMFYYLRQAPTSVFLGVWRRFCRIFKHQFHVRVRHIEECVYIEVLHHDNSHHCRQARETPTSFQGTLEQ